MTRINTIPVHLLIDQHLLAEYREITRVSGLARLAPDAPKEYVLGTGHVTFFYDKGIHLTRRTAQLYCECLERGFNVEYKLYQPHPLGLNWDWQPDAWAQRLNIDRLDQRCMFMKRTPTYYGKPVPRDYYNQMLRKGDVA